MTATTTQPYPLLDALRTDPGRTAICTTAGETLSAADFAAALQCVGQGLAAVGAERRRVATLLPDDWTTAAIVLGGARVASVFPLNPDLTPQRLQEDLEAAGAGALIGRREDAAAACIAAAAGLAFLAAEDLLAGAPDAARLPGTADRDPGLVLLTSGSTGTPKRVPLTEGALVRSAINIGRTLRLGPGDRALLSLPMFHIGAFVDLLLAPLLAGGEVVIAPRRDARSLWQAIELHRPTWIQLVPTMLGDMLRHRPDRIAPLRFVRSVSADLSADLQARAEAAFGCPVIQMYGMSETAGQIASNPLPPACRKPHSVGLPQGAEITIRGPDGTRLQQGETGEVCVRGPTVFSGYEGPAAADAFHGAWFRTGDLGRLDADGYLFLEGRLKDLVNRGGEKISPATVERAALRLAGIREASAYAAPHPTLGEQVALAVVAEPEVTQAEMLAHLSDHLAPFQMPRQVRVLAALPRLPGGKIDKRRLAATHGEGPAAVSPDPRGDPRVAALWSRLLGTETPGPGTDFFDAGGDSLAATTFILELEKLLGRPVSPNILFDHPTYGGLCDALAAAREEAPDTPPIRHARLLMAGWKGAAPSKGSMFRRFGAETGRVPLFWACQATEEVAAVTAAVGARRAIYAASSLFRFPGRTEADRSQLAARYAEEIVSIRPQGPLALGGFCEGARTMALVAEELSGWGVPVRLLVSADHWFEAPTGYPVCHIVSDTKREYPRAQLAFPVLHPAGACLMQTEVHHEDLMSAMPGLGPRLSGLLDGDEVLAPFDPSDVLPLPRRSEAYRARIRARVPWRWQPGGRARVEARLTNHSPHVWQPTATSGLALMGLVAGPDGRARNRFAGYAEITEPVPPGGETTLEMEVTAGQLRRPFLLCLQLVDQGIADLPWRTGGVAVYPRLPLFSRAG